MEKQQLQKNYSFFLGQAMLVSQDVIRLGILNVKDHPNNSAVELIKLICEFGRDKVDYVILEGILGAQKYKQMILELLRFFNNEAFIYYFDIPFAETLRRHSSRKKAQGFGAAEMKKWWLKKDFLKLPNEKNLGAELSQDEIVKLIIKDVTS
ncbi:hypothetical protein [Liquorilactobacillus oeni]|uniref:hypothetical protein n=1 Tax=Liquorilactobacillus oeni TaxID=303241 RepID=UPI001F2978BF|nr:hypothetical protein [Liquorilactobacillus oeni]